jgi:hypothetical protein
MFTCGLIISALLTVINGFWAKGNVWLSQHIPTKPQRVAVIGFLTSFLSGWAFGFSQDIVMTMVTSILGVFAGIGVYTTSQK